MFSYTGHHRRQSAVVYGGQRGVLNDWCRPTCVCTFNEKVCLQSDINMFTWKLISYVSYRYNAKNKIKNRSDFVFAQCNNRWTFFIMRRLSLNTECFSPHTYPPNIFFLSESIFYYREAWSTSSLLNIELCRWQCTSQINIWYTKLCCILNATQQAGSC